MSKFLQNRFSNLEAYVPGEQPDDMQYIKLNTNESPYPPPPGVAKALCGAEIQKLNLYPNPDGAPVIKKLAELYGVTDKDIILGNGSDEVLAFSFLAFFGAPAGVCFPDITYGFYPVYARLYGIPFELIPLEEDFTVKPERYLGVGKSIVLANPNAPTGIALARSEIEDIVQSNRDNIVIIDEAYVDFGAESAVPLTKKYDNLLVIQTFSKSRSLAGARLGYAIGAAPLIDDLKKMKFSFNPYNVNRVTQLAGYAALCDDEYFKEKQGEIIKTREITVSELKKLGFTATDSAANFVFVKSQAIRAETLYKKLRERGVLVRHFNTPRIDNWLRITVGTREEMESLVRVVRDIIGGYCGEKERD